MGAVVLDGARAASFDIGLRALAVDAWQLQGHRRKQGLSTERADSTAIRVPERTQAAFTKAKKWTTAGKQPRRKERMRGRMREGEIGREREGERTTVRAREHTRATRHTPAGASTKAQV